MGIPNFRTSILPKPANFHISHEDQLMAIGSCFAQNIGNQLHRHKFSSLLNPFGILYNPISIQNSLDRIIHKKLLEESALFENRGLWQHFDFHSQFAHADFSLAFRQMNQAVENAHNFLQKTNRLILTLGTAFVFRNKESGAVVANNHKLASTQFTRELLSVETITKQLASTLHSLNNTFPSLEIILTVSPVRHLKDGFIENQKSKSTLLLAAGELEKQFSNLHYFPAYEIMMDDLRDYRFYESDMIHPNGVAIHYIWEFFQTCFFSESTVALNQKINGIIKASQHRPLHPDAKEELSTFAERQLKKIGEIKNVNSLLDFSKEEKHFTQMIA